MVVNSAAEESIGAGTDVALTWNLRDLYETDEQWQDAVDKLAREVREVPRWRNGFRVSASEVADVLEAHSRIRRDLQRALVYAQLSTFEDRPDASARTMLRKVVQVATTFHNNSAFLAPDLMGLLGQALDAFLDEEPRLGVYRRYIEDVRSRAAHILPEREERLLIGARLVARSTAAAYQALLEQLPYPEFTTVAGRHERLDTECYTGLRRVPDAVDREQSALAYFGFLGTYARTFGELMNAAVCRARLEAAARGYRSAFHSALEEEGLTEDVYADLVGAVREQLPALHRYLRLRRTICGVERFSYADLDAPLPLVGSQGYSPEEACALVTAAAEYFGEEYVKVVKQALGQGWIDFRLNRRRSQSAFTTAAAYDVHPYASVDFSGTYLDVSTLAHELGHVVHGRLAACGQPFPLASLDSWLTEVAAIVSEGVLVRHLLDHATHDTVRLHALDCFLERIRTTLFRQMLFAEFAVLTHDIQRESGGLTGEVLSREYLRLARIYYGHDAGVCAVDPSVGYEWISIPHLRGGFSVLEYPLALVTSFALADRIAERERRSQDGYLAFLAAGSSAGARELLALAGVDLNVREAVRRVGRAVDAMTIELERLWRASSNGLGQRPSCANVDPCDCSS
jgi:oligoendopeptidase F